jgi:DNA (cytosine-5)-methyltransferase 1
MSSAKKWAYYNEFDKQAAAGLRELIKTGVITEGEVDERSIADVRPNDLCGFVRCHFFAGAGVWDYALQVAGWPVDREIWTGSAPCQAFSVAGEGKGTGDHRDLWPVFAALIRERGPDTIVGEQVSAAIGFGWLDRLRTDLEAEDYAVGSLVCGAHSAGADHIRQRVYWVADTERAGLSSEREALERRTGSDFAGGRGDFCRLADAEGGKRGGLRFESKEKGALGSDELSGVLRGIRNWDLEHTGGDRGEAGLSRPDQGQERVAGVADNSGNERNFWSYAAWHYCLDKKYRRFEPGIFPLVARAPRDLVHLRDQILQGDAEGQQEITEAEANSTDEARTMRLKWYGNACNAETAIMFVTAFMEGQ